MNTRPLDKAEPFPAIWRLCCLIALSAGMILLAGCVGPAGASEQRLPGSIVILPAGAVGPVDGQLSLVGQISSPSRSSRTQQAVKDILQVGDRIAYVAAGPAGLWILDLTVASQPEIAGSVAVAGNAGALAQVDHYLYVAAGEAGLQVFDITDPLAPVARGVFQTAGSAVDVVAASGVVFVTDEWQGVRVVDVSNPAQPAEVTTLAVGAARDLKVVGEHLYIAADEEGLYVMDISDPRNPVEFRHYAVPGDVHSIDVVGSYGYLAAGGAGLQVLNLAQPDGPVVGQWTEAYGRDLIVEGRHAFLASEDGGLHVLDISNPALPVKVAAYDTSGSLQRIDAGYGYLYLADRTGGLVILQFTPGS